MSTLNNNNDGNWVGLAIPLGVIDMFMSAEFAKELAYLEQGINPLGFTKAG